MEIAELQRIARGVSNEVIALWHYFRDNPRVSWDEDDTLKYIISWVEKQGLMDSLTLREGRGGIWFDFEIKPGEPFILFRADVDALRVKTPDGEFVIMHACGHDTHIAMLLTAMREILEINSSVTHNIRFVFQRAEEDYTAPQGSGGKVMVFEDNVCDNVAAAIALHVWSQKPSGFWTRLYQLLVNSDRAELIIRTTGGHAAMPHISSNALDFMIDLALAIRHLGQRLVSYQDGPVIINHTVSHAGGDIASANVVPSEARWCWSIRTGTKTAKDAVRAEMEELFKRHLDGRVLGYELNYVDGHPATVNDPELVKKMAHLLGALASTEHPIIPGGEDFGWIAQRVPSAMWMLGTGGIPGVTDISHHCHNFAVDESKLWEGVFFWLMMATNDLMPKK